MALSHLISVITGQPAVSSDGIMTDIDQFAAFTIRIPKGKNGSIDLWQVNPRKYGDQQLDKQTGMRADSDFARRARVDALRDAYNYLEPLELSPFTEEGEQALEDMGS